MPVFWPLPTHWSHGVLIPLHAAAGIATLMHIAFVMHLPMGSRGLKAVTKHKLGYDQWIPATPLAPLSVADLSGATPHCLKIIRWHFCPRKYPRHFRCARLYPRNGYEKIPVRWAIPWKARIGFTSVIFMIFVLGEIWKIQNFQGNSPNLYNNTNNGFHIKHADFAPAAHRNSQRRLRRPKKYCDQWCNSRSR